MALATHIDRGIQLVKWPVALATVLLLPATVWTVWDTIVSAGGNLVALLPFLAGGVIYWLLWVTLFKRPSWGSFLSTFEHELTHAIFAWLTLHRVTGLRTSWSSGGEVRFRGTGNWLITIAPYFFPTVSVLVALALALIPDAWLQWASVLLGLTLSYHATSTWRETHRNQPDLERVGFVFAWAFLPGANLFWYGVFLAFAAGGTEGASGFLTQIFEHTTSIYAALL